MVGGVTVRLEFMVGRVTMRLEVLLRGVSVRLIVLAGGVAVRLIVLSDGFAVRRELLATVSGTMSHGRALVMTKVGHILLFAPGVSWLNGTANGTMLRVRGRSNRLRAISSWNGERERSSAQKKSGGGFGELHFESTCE